MTTRPLVVNEERVQAILDGRKTQMRIWCLSFKRRGASDDEKPRT